MLHEMRLVGLAMDPFSNSPIVILKDKSSEPAKKRSSDQEDSDDLLDVDAGLPPVETFSLEEDDASEHLLPIWIGEAEANAIATELLGILPPRPMTHDLIKNVIVSLGGKVERVIITDLRDNTFYATIELGMENGEVLALDSRPSDALALALRSDAPIFVDEKVLKITQDSVENESGEASDNSEYLDNRNNAMDSEKWQEMMETLFADSLGKYKQ